MKIPEEFHEIIYCLIGSRHDRKSLSLDHFRDANCRRNKTRRYSESPFPLSKRHNKLSTENRTLVFIEICVEIGKLR